MFSPRFGKLCCCIRSLRHISRGEEIFVDYGYDKVGDNEWPDWYRDGWKKLDKAKV